MGSAEQCTEDFYANNFYRRKWGASGLVDVTV